MFVLMFRLQKYYKKMEYTRLWTKKIIMLAFFTKKETTKGLLLISYFLMVYWTCAPWALKILPSRRMRS